MDRYLLTIPISIMLLLLTPNVAQAGPCSADIAGFEMAIRQSGSESRANDPPPIAVLGNLRARYTTR
jgi:hypothetical protein